MKQIFLLLAAAAAFIIAVGLMNQKLSISPARTTKTVSVGNTKISVEVANSEALRRKGLSGRTSLEANGGMFFVFTQKGVKPAFWMKDMLIPLDIIWIKNSEVFQINKNVQPPKKGAPDSQLSLILPKDPIDYVLEVNAGFSDKNGVVEGTPVDLSGI